MGTGFSNTHETNRRFFLIIFFKGLPRLGARETRSLGAYKIFTIDVFVERDTIILFINNQTNYQE